MASPDAVHLLQSELDLELEIEQARTSTVHWSVRSVPVTVPSCWVSGGQHRVLVHGALVVLAHALHVLFASFLLAQEGSEDEQDEALERCTDQGSFAGRLRRCPDGVATRRPPVSAPPPYLPLPT